MSHVSTLTLLINDLISSMREQSLLSSKLTEALVFLRTFLFHV